MKTLLHFGYPKCGSTSLQENLFAKLESCNMIYPQLDSRGQSDGESPINSLFWKIRFDTSEHEQLGLDGCGHIDAYSEIAGQHNTYKVQIYSDEGIQVPPDCCDLNTVLKRIHAIFPDATILLVTRPQHEIIQSYWRMHPWDIWNNNRSRILDPDQFCEKFFSIETNPLWEFLRFNLTKRRVEAYWGNDSVIELRFEDIFKVRDQASFQALANILDSDPDVCRQLLVETPARNTQDGYRHLYFTRGVLGRLGLSGTILPVRVRASLLKSLNKILPSKTLSAKSVLKIKEFYGY